MRALVVCKHPENSEESAACKLIKKEGLEIVYSWKNTLSEKDLKGIDLIIAVGGDGTVLSASHFIKSQPLLAVNSSPSTSEGALTSIPLEKLESKLDDILKGKMKLSLRERIQVLINNKPLDLLALNEVFIANEKAYLISKYNLKIKNTEELQLSSGLIFTTGTGSTGWFCSAGGHPFSPSDKFIKLIVREPYTGKIYKPKIKESIIKENEEIQVTLLTPSVLAIDSIREYPLKPKDVVTIKISSLPLNMIL
jgi:NAD+ kinase